MKIEIKFDFGTGVDGNGVPLDAYAVAMALPQITAEAAKLAGGCNLVRREGTRYEGAALVREPGCTLVIVVAAFEPALEAKCALVATIKQLLSQKSVLVTSTEVRSGIL